jgi:hypothetical protein
MNGSLTFKVIDDYIQDKIDIKVLDNFFRLKDKLEYFDEKLFFKFVETYKYCRTQTKAWDENNITNMLIRDIMTSSKSSHNLSFNVFKGNGKYETSFGDIAFIIRFNYQNGKSFEGYAFIEGKRDYSNYKFQYHELKQKQINRFVQNTISSFFCFYSHDAFFPVVKTEYLKHHLENLNLSNINQLDYNLLTNTIKPITFQQQYNRFINGYDLDYGEKPKSIAYGFDENFFPKTIFVINKFGVGMTPTPTETPNRSKYKEVLADNILNKNNIADDDISYKMNR